MARYYVSNKNESVRMFQSDFMEWFSHIHPATPIVLYVPLVAWMLYLASADRGLSWIAIAGLFLVGVVYWTLVEYLLHRFVFHYEPKSAWGKRLHFTMHGVMLQYRFWMEWLIDVPPESFDPPPKVDSAVDRLIPKPPGEHKARNPDKLASVVLAAFAQRRKMLRNTLKGLLDDLPDSLRSASTRRCVRKTCRSTITSGSLIT